MAVVDRLYDNLITEILVHGFRYKDKSRADIEMLQIPHYQLEIPIQHKPFPLLTSKKINWKAVAHEFIWMLSGSNYIDYLIANNVHIWTEDAKNFSGSHYVGPIYGHQWRNFGLLESPNNSSDINTIDQISGLLKGLKSDLFNRRHLITAWNPVHLDKMALPPCHWSFEIMPCMADNGYVGFCLKWHQRSVDTFLGLPFDIASYAFMGKLIELLTDLPFVSLIGDLSNVHIYHPHMDAIKEVSKRELNWEGPSFEFDADTTFDNISIDKFNLEGYYPQPYIKAKLFTKVK